VKKLLAILALIAIASVAVSFFYRRKIVLAFATPEKKACARVGELCASEHEGSREDLDRCVDGMQQAKKIAGPKSVDQSVQCINEATTCGKAMGCVMGGVGIGAMKEFVKGVGDAVTR
jgi:hypothetical protein